MNIAEALKLAMEKKEMEKMEMAEAIRIIFADKGYDILFDYARLRAFLWDMAPEEDLVRKRFSMIYDSGAIAHIKEATHDPYHYKENFEKAERVLSETGLGPEIAHETIFTLYDALGFPVDRPYKDPQRIDQDGHWTYFGEVKDGVQHGRGHEELVFDGKVYNKRDGLWINGQVYGFLCTVEELGAVEYCFCVNGMIKGKDTHVYGEEIFVDEY